jgi:hypothetical protein
MKTKFIIGLLVLVFLGCNNKETKTDIKKAKEREYFDKGIIDPSETAELKLVKITADPASDASINFLKPDNYYADQFSCVVHGYSYYRLTNTHRTSLITGCVTKSWLYEGKIVYEHVPFTLKPGGWQTFGCFFVTASQPITFTICSFFGTAQRCPCPNK